MSTGTAAVLTAGLSQLGVPYSWGGEVPGKDFDCSGLVQWAYQQAGIQLPRTSQAQFAVATPISASQAQPGDLVFMAGSDGTPQAPGHVGIYLGAGRYLNAPYTGANVRIDAVPLDATFGTIAGIPQNAGSAAPSVLASLPGGSLNPANAITGAAGAVGAIEKVAGDLVSVNWWRRFGVGTLGAALVLFGIVVYFAGTDTGRETIEGLV